MNEADLSKQAQRQRLLAHLQTGSPLATSWARQYLHVMSPAARILELRREGYRIDTTWRDVPDASGVIHRQGVYVLRGFVP